MENTDKFIIDFLDILLKNKKFIFLFTSILTLVIVIYVFFKPNIYKVDSIIEIGKINKHFLENPTLLVDKLKIKYDLNNQNQYPKIYNIKIINSKSSLVQISVIGFSKEKINKFIKDINNEIIVRHNAVLQKYKTNINYALEIYIKELNRINQIINNKNKEYKNNKKKAFNLSKANPSLSAIYLIEVLRQENEIQLLIKDKIDLIQKINLEKMKLLSNNIKATKVIKVINYKNHFKPKRKIFIIIGFITSFILSIFLVLFFEFINNLRKKEN